MRGATHKLTCPVLLLAGTKDEITPLATSRAVVRNGRIVAYWSTREIICKPQLCGKKGSLLRKFDFSIIAFFCEGCLRYFKQMMAAIINELPTYDWLPYAFSSRSPTRQGILAIREIATGPSVSSATLRVNSAIELRFMEAIKQCSLFGVNRVFAYAQGRRKAALRPTGSRRAACTVSFENCLAMSLHFGRHKDVTMLSSSQFPNIFSVLLLFPVLFAQSGRLVE